MRASIVSGFTAFAAIQVTFGAPQTISTTARCGQSFGLTCRGSSFGNCCSQYGYCGSTNGHCGNGCQPGWGSCTSTVPVTLKVSTNGRCGGDSGSTCSGSKYGNCCSQYGYCGSTNSYCGTGCKALFGTCSGSQSSSSSISRTQSSTTTRGSLSASSTTRSSLSTSPSSTPGLVVSTNARCGNAYQASPGGMTCRGSKYGNCCSQYSYCGSTKDYCGTGCQPGFGDCLAVSSSSSRFSSTSKVSSSTASASKTSSSTSSAITTSSSSVSLSTASSTGLSSSIASSSSSSPSSPSSSSSSSSVSATPSLSSSMASSSSSMFVTTTPTPSSSLAPTPTPTPSTPSGVCGRTAYPANRGPADAYDTDYQSSLALCSEKCRTSSPCQYLILLAETECYLFNTPLSQEGALVEQSDLVLYERSCFPPFIPTSSSSAPVQLSSTSSLSASSSSIAPSSSSTSLSSSALSVVSSSTSAATPSATPYVPYGICGRAGYPSSDSNQFPEASGDSSISACGRACRARPTCKYIIYVSGRTCVLSNTPISGDSEFFDDESDVVTYETTCFPPI